MNPNKVKKIAIIALIFAIIGWELPILDFSSETYINATDITDIGFASSAGNNVSLISEHDNRPWNGTEAAGSPWTVYITFTNVSTFNYVESIMKYNSTGVAPSQHEINLSVWCVTMQEWEELEDSSLDIEYHYRATRIINTSHYISPVLNGTVVLKLNHGDAGNANHRLWIDLLRLINEPRLEQINNTISSGTGGAGCTGNCSFDGVWTNSLRKNDTGDIYNAYINLSSPFGKFNTAGNIFSLFALPNGEYSQIQSTNSTSGNFSQVYVSPEEILLEVTDGDTTSYRLGHTTIEQIISGTTYKYNGTHMDYGGASQINVGNITMNNKNISGLNMINDNNITFNDTRVTFNDNISYYNNSTGVQKFSNDYNFDYLFQEAHDGIVPSNLVAFQTIDNTGFNFFQGRKARGSVNWSNKSAIIEPVVDGDVMFRIVGTGWDGVTWGGTSGAIDFTANGTWTSTSHPTKLEFYTRDDSGSFIKRMTVLKNGSVQLNSLIHSTATANDYVCVTPDGVLITQTAGCV